MKDDTFERRKKILNDFIHDKDYVPMKIKEIAVILNIPREQRPELKEVLDELVAEGKIGLSVKGKYARAENTAFTGIFESTDKGFGFVVPDDGHEDVFISEKDVNGAFFGDRVSFIITADKNSGRRREGKIIKILKRNTEQIVGIYQKNSSYGFVVPDNRKFHRDVYISKGHELEAVDGHKVVAKITDFGDETHNPEGIIIRILGHTNDPGVDILSIVESYELPYVFPDEVIQEVASLPDNDELEINEREDFRNLLTVTIDGEEAKDYDDAVSLSMEGGLYRLGVHIADVSEYVREGGKLDKEAVKRGTSVYLVDRVIPMLPHRLSNGICSLNQGRDKYTLSCVMDIDDRGNIVSHKICESVINVNKRMTYTGVNKILEGEVPADDGESEELVKMLRQMDELAAALREKRHKRGSIDFDFPESRIIINDAGEPIEIMPYERNRATNMIEDFMLAANETVAEDYYWQQIPFIYRTHNNPDEDKIKELATFINNFGYSVRISNNEIHPKELQKLITQIQGSEEESLISRLTLRAMKRAGYTVDCTGHFGLAAKYYTHFTSPIRRYPDLQIHRIIKENIRSGLSDARLRHYEKLLPEIAKQSSSAERKAEETEREADKMKKAEYMSKRIGQTFNGVISGITSWGIYVELPDTVEGMVHVNELEGDCFFFDENTYEMVGKKTHRTYKLGQRVKVLCIKADKYLKTVDFRFDENNDKNNDAEAIEKKTEI